MLLLQMRPNCYTVCYLNVSLRFRRTPISSECRHQKVLGPHDESLRWLPRVSSKVKKYKFQPQKLSMDISEKNETKVMH